MNLSVNASLNIALDIVSLLVLSVVLYSSIVQKQKKNTQRIFLYWIFNLIGLLLCELLLEIACLKLAAEPENGFRLIVHRILFVFDFFIYNLLPVTYYRYIASFLTPSPKEAGRIRFGLKLSIINLFIFTFIFASSLYTGWFYTIDAESFESYSWPYLILESAVLMNWHLQLIPFKMYKRTNGRKKSFILSLYVLLPILLLPIDYVLNLTFSYTAYALVTLLIFVEVDIQQTKERALFEADLAQQEKKMKDMQVELMMAQIHPHFLYNTLSTIACLCRQDPVEAEAATNDFSNYLKANLRSINSTKPIPFQNELLHAESYLNIQKRRFPDSLRVIYDIQAKDFQLPALTLQTVVENAIKHAVEIRYEPTTVKIATTETPESYIISVEDDGPGFDTAVPISPDHPHVGIDSTQARLQEMSDGSLKIDSTPGKGTLITITIPKKEK